MRLGSHPVHSSLDPVTIQSLATAAGIPGDFAGQVQHGFDLLFYGGALHSVPANHPSADVHADFVAEELAKGVARHQLLDVTAIYNALPTLPAAVSPMAVVPKGVPGSGELRLITDGTYGRGSSVNSYIDPTAASPCRLTQAREMGDAIYAQRVLHGPGADLTMQVYDIVDAYRAVPTRVDDYWKVLLCHRGRLYAATAGQFGIRTHGYWLAMITHCLALKARRESAAAAGVFVDDTLLCAEDSLLQLASRMFVDSCKAAGLTISEKKLLLQGAPGPVKTWIGLVWDTATGTVSLPLDKHDRIASAATSLAGRSRVLCRDLLAVLGLVNFATACVSVLATCVSNVTACTRGVPHHHWVVLSPAAKDEILTWNAVLAEFNGVSLIPRTVRASTAVSVTSDASDIGGGFFCDQTRVFASWLWPPAIRACLPSGMHITKLETAAGVLAIAAVGTSSTVQALGAAAAVLLRSDASATVANIESLRARAPAIAPLTRTAAVLAARHHFRPLSVHVQGLLNEADPLSRGVVPARFTEPGWTRLHYSEQQLLHLLESPAPWLPASAWAVTPLLFAPSVPA